jgi:Flp pilus assembly pilin Flp
LDRATLKRFRDDDRGAVMTEYIVVTGFVAIVALPALLYCGVALARSFAFVRDYALYPFP